MDQQTWNDCHVAAFRFFGGVPHRIVPDNLKTGVPKPDLYDPAFNRAYEEVAHHFRFLIDPARVRNLQIVQVPIDELHPDPANPRKISDSELDNLTRSMASSASSSPSLPDTMTT